MEKLQPINALQLFNNLMDKSERILFSRVTVPTVDNGRETSSNLIIITAINISIVS